MAEDPLKLQVGERGSECPPGLLDWLCQEVFRQPEGERAAGVPAEPLFQSRGHISCPILFSVVL